MKFMWFYINSTVFVLFGKTMVSILKYDELENHTVISGVHIMMTEKSA